MTYSLQELLEREARYRSIVESQTETICRFTPEGRITFANTAFKKTFGYSNEQLPEQNFINLLPITLQIEAEQKLRSLHPDTPEATIVYHPKQANNRYDWQRWELLGLFDHTGKLVEVQALGRRVTYRQTRQIEEAQHTRQLSALHHATAALLSTLDLEKLLGQILDAATSAIPSASRGSLHLVVRETGKLETRALFGYPESDPRIQKIAPRSQRNYIALAVQQQRPLRLDRLPEDTVPISAEALPARSAIIAPLVLGGEVLGALALEASEPKAFNEMDLRLLVSFAATATAAIRNAQLHAEVQLQAITDTLTGLYNRRGFFELGRHELERAHRFERPLALIMIDLDLFKEINDNFGHAAGDQVLQAIANRLNESVRKVDIVGRYGGDEFLILLPETDLFTATRVAERLRENLTGEPFYVDGEALTIAASLGVAKVMPETRNLEMIIARADAAMYRAKNGGRNRTEVG